MTPPSPRALRKLDSAAWTWLAYVSVAIFIVATFSGLRMNAPVWDDALLTVRNPYLSSWRHVGTFFTTDIWSASGLREPSRFYRPLPMLSYLVNARLFGASALSFHAGNVVLHIANSWLLLTDLRRRRLTRSLALPYVMTLGFALAPINVEAVAWIAGRFDLLGVTCVLGGLLVNRGRGLWCRMGTVVALALALLCKESFVLGAFLVIADDELVLGRRIRQQWPKYAAFALSAVAFLLARKAVGVVSMEAVTATGAQTLVESFAFLVVTYAHAVVRPSVLDPFRPYAPMDGLATASTIAAVTLAGVLLSAWIRRNRHAGDPRRGAVAFGVVWVVIGFVPTALAGPNLGMVGDRYAYFPLVGAFIAASSLASLALERAAAWLAAHDLSLAAVQVALMAVCVVLLGSSVARTRERIRDWQDERTLFTASLRDDPENPYALYSLGTLEAESGHFEDADLLLGRALAKRPSSWRTLDSLCYVRLHERDLAAASRYCRESLAEKPDNPRGWVNLASVYVTRGDWPAGYDAASHAIQLKPSAAEAYFLRAACLANMGGYEDARADLGAVLTADPSHAGARDLLRQIDARQREQATPP